jgi:hypothetical protein
MTPRMVADTRINEGDEPLATQDWLSRTFFPGLLGSREDVWPDQGTFDVFLGCSYVDGISGMAYMWLGQATAQQ